MLVFVESKAIKSVDHDKATEVLTVTFHNGSIAKYAKVDRDMFGDLIMADSVGAFFNKVIRPMGMMK